MPGSKVARCLQAVSCSRSRTKKCQFVINGTDATINKNNKVIKIVTIDSQAAMILALLGSALAMPQSALSATGFVPGGPGKEPSKRVIKHTDKTSPSGDTIHESTEYIYYDVV